MKLIISVTDDDGNIYTVNQIISEPAKIAQSVTDSAKQIQDGFEAMIAGNALRAKRQKAKS